MSNTYECMVKLIKSSLFNQAISIELFNDVNPDDLYNEATDHSVHGIIYPVLSKIDDFVKCNRDIYNKWRITVINLSFKLSVNFDRTKEIFQIIKNDGIEVVALKGIVLKDYYPYTETRYMGDLDILIRKKDIDAVDRILTHMDYQCVSKEQKKHLQYYHKNYMPVEVHTSLIDDYYFNNAASFEAKVWDNLIEKEICGVSVKSLSNEYLILHIVLHMVTHFIHDGFGLRHLCDLAFLLQKERLHVDWNIVFRIVKESNIDKFAYSVFLACNKIFDIGIPINKEFYNEELTDKLISDIFSSGAFGQKTDEWKCANLIIKHRRENSENKLKQIIQFIFPDKNYFNEKFQYTKKIKVLIVFAWFHRIYKGIFRKDLDWNHKLVLFIGNSKISHIVKERYALLSEYGLVKTKKGN